MVKRVISRENRRKAGTAVDEIAQHEPKPSGPYAAEACGSGFDHVDLDRLNFDAEFFQPLDGSFNVRARAFQLK